MKKIILPCNLHSLWKTHSSQFSKNNMHFSSFLPLLMQSLSLKLSSLHYLLKSFKRDLSIISLKKLSLTLISPTAINHSLSDCHGIIFQLLFSTYSILLLLWLHIYRHNFSISLYGPPEIHLICVHFCFLTRLWLPQIALLITIINCDANGCKLNKHIYFIC